jgi:hypothetical protein
MSRIINAFDGILLALNKVPGMEFVELVGRNADIDTGGGLPETIWPAGGVYSFRSAAAIVEVVSSSVEDDILTAGAVAGTGAHTIVIEGLDEDYKPVREEITLNGTAAVDGTVEFLRINSVYVGDVGSGGTNAGNITIRDDSAGTTRAYIGAGRGRSEQMVYTVPADHNLILLGWYIAARDASGASFADIDFRERHNATSEAWHVAWSATVERLFPSPFNLIGHPFPEKTDIEMRATSVDADNTVVDFHGHAILVGPNAL